MSELIAAIDDLPRRDLLALVAHIAHRLALDEPTEVQPESDDTFLSLEQVAERIPYSPKTIRKLMGNGELKEGEHYFRPRGLRRARPVFAWKAMERWIRDRATTTPAAVLQLHTGGRRGRTIG